MKPLIKDFKQIKIIKLQLDNKYNLYFLKLFQIYFNGN